MMSSLPVKAVIQQTLPVLRDIVDSISGESTKSRQICYQSLQESVQVSLSLFPVFIQQPGQCLIHSWTSHPPITFGTLHPSTVAHKHLVLTCSSYFFPSVLTTSDKFSLVQQSSNFYKYQKFLDFWTFHSSPDQQQMSYNTKHTLLLCGISFF